MTGPQPVESPELARIAAHAAALYALEEAAAAVSAGPLRAAVTRLMRFLGRQWITVFGSTATQANPVGLVRFVGDVRSELRTIRPNVAVPLARYAVQAQRLGARQAVDELPVDVDVDLAALEDEVLSTEVQRVLDDLDDDLAEHLSTADQALSDLAGDAAFSDAVTAASPAAQAATSAELAASWVTNRGANDGVALVADELGVERIWLAERDACATCLALSGEVSVDGRWDPDATFGPSPLAVWPGPDLTDPPRHPRCRCRSQPWLGSEMPDGVPDLREVLKREAERSILTGWRLPSESERLRLGAAERLLVSGTNLPSTVQARARQAVKRGSFDTFPRIKTRATTR
jgi:hypothetical protein